MKLSNLRILLLLLLLFAMSINIIIAQQTTNEKYDWELYKEIQGVEIYTKIQECHNIKYDTHKECYLLKFVNTTQSEVQISWKPNLWYNDICRTCDINSDEYNYTLLISANESIEGNCDINNQKLKIFRRFLNYRDKSELTKYELVNIEVE